jgi:hypothetical protein
VVTVVDVVANFGREAKSKLPSAVVRSASEDRLHNPLGHFFDAMAELSRLTHSRLVLVGESSLSDLHVRPDSAVSYRDKLTLWKASMSR